MQYVEGSLRSLRASIGRSVAMAVVLSAMLIGHSASASSALSLQTVGDFLSLGANTSRELQEAISQAGDEARITLEAVKRDLDELIGVIEAVYRDNLDITLDSLDTAAAQLFIRLEALVDGIRNDIDAVTASVGEEARLTIEAAGDEIEELLPQLEETVDGVLVSGGETAAFILDEGTLDLLLIIAIGIGLVALLLAILLGLIFEQPKFLGLLVVCLVAGILVPRPVREAIVIRADSDELLKRETVPYIIRVEPDQLVVGETAEIHVWGSNLTPSAELPSARVGDRLVQIKADSPTRLVLDATELTAVGSRTLSLEYADSQLATDLREVLELEAPPEAPLLPNLRFKSIVLEPQSPLPGEDVVATVTVINDGPSGSGEFDVVWTPVGDQPRLQQAIRSMEPGAERVLTFDHRYRDEDLGRHETAFRIDTGENVRESEENDNFDRVSVEVRAFPRCQERSQAIDASGLPQPLVVPSHVSGDREFGGNGPRLRVRVEFRWNTQQVLMRATFEAVEWDVARGRKAGDQTSAVGSSDWLTVYQASAGEELVGLSLDEPVDEVVVVDDNGRNQIVDTYEPLSEIIRGFTAVGDRGIEDVGRADEEGTKLLSVDVSGIKAVVVESGSDCR